jgi:hypothetical protein
MSVCTSRAVTSDPCAPLTICHGAAWFITGVSGTPSIAKPLLF